MTNNGPFTKLEEANLNHDSSEVCISDVQPLGALFGGIVNPKWWFIKYK